MTARHRSTRARDLALVTVTVAATVVTGVAAAGAATAAPTSWVATATQALKPASATLLGPAPASAPLRLTVGLASGDRAGLDALIRRQATPGSADYGRYLTPAQFTSRFAPSQATAAAVADYLRSQGMTGVRVASNRLQVTADATVAQAEQAFHTAIAQFRQNGRTVLVNTADAQVPSSLAGAVTGVLGLSTLGFRLSPTPSVPNLNGFYPKDLGTVYDVGATTAGDGQTLAVIAEGDLTQTVTDLRTAESEQGLPQTPVTLVNTGPAGSDTSGTDEWDLDTQTSTGVAPNANLTVYIASSLTDSDLARAINRFASDGTAVAGSASLGECDILPFLDGSMVMDDVALAEAAAQGQTFFASSGDTGSSCAVLPTNGVPAAGLPDTEYPASSPYTVGVGGTTLLAGADDTYTSEVAWNAGGGGISPVENSPAWQNGVVPSAAAGLRGVPDIAFDADPNTGALIYVDGTPTQIGGTSLSSPLAMGLWTRIQAGHGGGLGFAAPKLYGLYSTAQGGSPLPPSSVPGFRDVLAGVNGTYSATPGWDYTTGLGSWDVAALSNALH